MVYSVGLTGSIASGKSTVARAFQNLGAQLICSDSIARLLTAKNQVAFKKIISHFGQEMLQENGELNRSLLRKRIFDEPKERLWLEKLLHPLIRSELKKQARESKNLYSIIEIPLLYRREDYPWLSRILVVSAPEKLQLARIMTRDSCSEEEAKAIVAVQNAQVDYAKLADDLLINDGDLLKLEEAVRGLDRLYKRLS